MKKDVPLNKIVTTGTKLYTAVRLFTISKKLLSLSGNRRSGLKLVYVNCKK